MKRCAGGIEYELTRKAVKNLNLRLRPDGSVTVSIPKRVTLAEDETGGSLFDKLSAVGGSDRGDHTPGRGTLLTLSGASLLPGPPAHPMAEPSAGTGAPGDDRRSGAPSGGVLSPPSG